MALYRPRPGRHLYRHVGGDVTVLTDFGAGTLDPDEDFLPPANTVEDLAGTWVIGPGGERVEVDHVVAIRPTVVESTTAPPFGEWEEVDEIDVPDSGEEWERARNFGEDVKEFDEIPAITDDPVFQLNEIANPLGHTVEWEGDFLRIRPTGAVHDHQCQHLATSLDDARRYLRSRAENVVWTLDVQDPRYEMMWSDSGGRTAIVLVDVETGERSRALYGGVTSRNTRNARGEPSAFFSRDEQPPVVGRWYR